MIRGLILLFIASQALSAGPLYRHKDGKVSQEFENAYQDIRGAKAAAKQASDAAVTITEWTAYTPTGGWSSNVTYTGKWRRVGDTMDVQFKIACSGAPNNATPTISLPSSYTIDTAKMVEATDEQTTIGEGLAVDTGTAQYPLKVLYGSSTSAVKLKTIDVSGSDTLLGVMNSNAIPFSFGNGDSLHGRFSVPISGWTTTN